MKLFLVTVRDSASVSHHAPLAFPAIGQAERWFRDECNSPNGDSMLAKHPEDHELHLIGTFDTDDASVSQEPARLLIRGLDCRKSA